MSGTRRDTVGAEVVYRIGGLVDVIMLYDPPRGGIYDVSSSVADEPQAALLVVKQRFDMNSDGIAPIVRELDCFDDPSLCVLVHQFGVRGRSSRYPGRPP